MAARLSSANGVRYRTGRGRSVSFCFLKDQQPLPPAACTRAAKLTRQLHSIIEDRPAFLKRSRRDPEIHLPRGIWDLGDPLHTASRLALSGDPNVLRHLRLFSQSFTGYQLLSLRRVDGLPIPTAIPEDADDQLARLAADVDIVVDRYIDMTRHLPEALHLSPPPQLGEVGWVWDGKIINHDTQAYLERVALLAESGKLWELRNRGSAEAAPRILEIGSGFGGLAYHLKKLVPQARYYCVDIPESLAFSAVYLTTLFPDEQNVLIGPDTLNGLCLDGPGFTFVPNFLFDDCVAAGLKFDLIVNTLSMSEMAEKQVRHYCEGIVRLLGRNGVFFEQNQDNRHLGHLDARRIIGSRLPFCVPLSSAVRPLIQGAAHLWATQATAPFPWMESCRYVESLQDPFMAPAIAQELAHLRAMVKGMQSSKFWKLRTAWVKCKKVLGLAERN